MEGSKMRKVIMVIALLLTSIFAVYSANAYVYYVEAEDFDPDNSEPVVAGAIWKVVENRDAFNEQYLQYTGPHAGATTSVLYPLPRISNDAGSWKVWIYCFMPDGGSDSYFFYVSNDGGNEWGPQQAAHGTEGQEWKWVNWVLSTQPKKGDESVFKISERESAQADLICIRNDNLAPSEEEYEKWLEDNKDGNLAVRPLHKLTTTWGHAKSAY